MEEGFPILPSLWWSTSLHAACFPSPSKVSTEISSSCSPEDVMYDIFGRVFPIDHRVSCDLLLQFRVFVSSHVEQSSQNERHFWLVKPVFQTILGRHLHQQNAHSLALVKVEGQKDMEPSATIHVNCELFCEAGPVFVVSGHANVGSIQIHTCMAASTGNERPS